MTPAMTAAVWAAWAWAAVAVTAAGIAIHRRNRQGEAMTEPRPESLPNGEDSSADPRQPAYDAVYAYLTSTNHVPGDLVTRNAMIWRGVHAALAAIPETKQQPTDQLLHGQPAPYRQLLARLETDRQQMLAAVDTTTRDKEELRQAQAQSDLASGYLYAAALAVRLFEGVDAAAQYIRHHGDGRHLVAHDGPTVAEAAADDRNWDVEKGGE
ncbi:hypothetical protein GCM10009837_06990 [Streptomyces durmitorensis]|uniref:Secreted protein n=1 Tax=Streptomyces durmitorensis TaxID=319947 RepID=A0ABY4PKX3_9ACTN|nr:hypothetical protein [Streptomyces durmitorensis]UQT54405.1 hypothetical protein M4V62_04485 [Streptomyces durmitorensis]